MNSVKAKLVNEKPGILYYINTTSKQEIDFQGAFLPQHRYVIQLFDDINLEL